MALEIEWAGVPFLPVFHHDGHFFRAPGIYAFVRNLAGVRTILFVDHSNNIATATESHRLWCELIRLGCNELNVNLKAVERVDRLVLAAHIVRRCEPLLNVLEDMTCPMAEDLRIAGSRSYAR